MTTSPPVLSWRMKHKDVKKTARSLEHASLLLCWWFLFFFLSFFLDVGGKGMLREIRKKEIGQISDQPGIWFKFKELRRIFSFFSRKPLINNFFFFFLLLLLRSPFAFSPQTRRQISFFSNRACFDQTKDSLLQVWELLRFVSSDKLCSCYLTLVCECLVIVLGRLCRMNGESLFWIHRKQLYLVGKKTQIKLKETSLA